jgi:phytoene dehydrogenase-like protein
MVERVAIAGGGLAGLTAACHLAEAGVDVRLFERRESVGGRVRTREREGFRLDRGFQVLFTAYPAVERELDLDALDLRRFDPGATIARRGSRSVLADPFRDPGSLLESALNREVTLRDKLRTLFLRREALRGDPDSIETDDRSIREALRARGFSEAFVDSFAAPFYGGITLDRSLSDTSAFVFGYTFAMLSAGATAVPATGMGAIPAQLAERAERAGATIETGRPVSGVSGADRPASETLGSVTVDSGGEATLVLEDETVDAEAVIVATDPPTARDLTDVPSIPTGSRGCVTQYLALPRETALDGARRLVLNPTTEGPNQVAPLSAVAPEYAPEGRSLLSATYLGSPGADGVPGPFDADDGDLLGRTRETLERWYPERDFGGMELLETDRIGFAQFRQPPGFREGLPAVDAPDGDVFLAGDYTRWSSIQGAMASGRDAATAALDAIGRT